jgi:hypothetical protein
MVFPVGKFLVAWNSQSQINGEYYFVYNGIKTNFSWKPSVLGLGKFSLSGFVEFSYKDWEFPH